MYRTRYSCQIVIKLEIRKLTQISDFMKSRAVRADLFHAVRQTDGDKDRHDEAMSRFSKFCERSKNGTFRNRVWGRYLASAGPGSSEGN